MVDLPGAPLSAVWLECERAGRRMLAVVDALLQRRLVQPLE
jgi:hypothetical protein